LRVTGGLSPIGQVSHVAEQARRSAEVSLHVIAWAAREPPHNRPVDRRPASVDRDLYEGRTEPARRPHQAVHTERGRDADSIESAPREEVPAGQP
jgi:hypothetical protein